MKHRLFAGLGAVVLAAALGPIQTAPADAKPRATVSPDAIAATAPADYTGYRRYRRGYPYRYGYYRRNRGGALVAGAALGLIGGIATAAAAQSYYDRPYYGGYYGYPAYSYGYGYPGYGYAYPAYSYGYGYPYGGYRRAYYGGGWGYGGYRRVGWYGGGPYGGVRYRSGGWRW
jgi:hypothetical protein